MKLRGAKMKVSCFRVIWRGSTGNSVSSRLLNKLMIHFQSNASPNHFHVVLVWFGSCQKQPIKCIYLKQVKMSMFPSLMPRFFPPGCCFALQISGRFLLIGFSGRVSAFVSVSVKQPLTSLTILTDYILRDRWKQKTVRFSREELVLNFDTQETETYSSL